MISIGEIGRINKPLVWTLHDTWAFCGMEHYFPIGDTRYVEGYLADNRLPEERGFDLNRWTWGRKRRAWSRPMNLICPSRWMADCVAGSALMRNWPACVVPNAIDIGRYSPIEKNLSRDILGLPAHAPIILFGAAGGTPDRRKGFDLLLAALAQGWGGLERDPICAIYGQSEPRHPPSSPLPLHWLGHLDDDHSLKLAYSAADVFVLPSRQDNLPLTGIEAHACGCPVVAFDSTGLKDIVEHRSTGYLASPFDPTDLARGLRWVITDPQRHSRLRENARQRALDRWSSSRIASLHSEIYQAITSLG